MQARELVRQWLKETTPEQVRSVMRAFRRSGSQAVAAVSRVISEEARDRETSASSTRVNSIIEQNLVRNCSEFYALMDFSHLRRAAVRSGLSLSGEILEIGGCTVPGLPLALLLAGADRVHSNNILPVSSRIPLGFAKTIELVLQLGGQTSRRLSEVVTDVGPSEVALKESLFVSHELTEGASIRLPDASVDVICSFTVMEHVQAPSTLLATNHRLLRPGGWSFDMIDLRDHRDFSKPLRFLEYSDEECERLGVGENRWRCSDFVAAYRLAGFELADVGYRTGFRLLDPHSTDFMEDFERDYEILYASGLEDVSPWVTEEKRRNLDVRFHNCSLAELSVLGLNVTANKL